MLLAVIPHCLCSYIKSMLLKECGENKAYGYNTQAVYTSPELIVPYTVNDESLAWL